MNDQCGWYSAPAAIHALSSSFCAAVSFLWSSAAASPRPGRRRRSAAISSLSSGLPGTMAPALTATSRRSSRRSALRAALSGPWQAKQFSARIGRMSRLKLGFESAAQTESAKQANDPASRARDKATIERTGLGNAHRPLAGGFDLRASSWGKTRTAQDLDATDNLRRAAGARQTVACDCSVIIIAEANCFDKIVTKLSCENRKSGMDCRNRSRYVQLPALVWFKRDDPARRRADVELLKVGKAIPIRARRLARRRDRTGSRYSKLLT